MLVRLFSSGLLACLVMAATGCQCMYPGMATVMYGAPGAACGGGVAGCDSGCGDVYWGEWVSDPPACGASCGGHGCCWPFPLLNGLHALWGYRYVPGGEVVGYDAGCPTCGGSAVEYLPGEAVPAEPVPAEAGSAAPRPSLPTPQLDEEAAVHRQQTVRHASYPHSPQPRRSQARVLR